MIAYKAIEKWKAEENARPSNLTREEQRLQKRLQQMEAAITEALTWLNFHAPSRAYEALQKLFEPDESSSN